MRSFKGAFFALAALSFACGGGESTPGSDGASGGMGGSASGGSSNSSDELSLPGLDCEPGQVIYQGTVDGVAISESLQPSFRALTAADTMAFSNGFSIVGYTEPAGDGPTRKVAGAIGFPQGSSRAGQVWCIDEGVQPTGDGNEFSYRGHLLGTCPGTATSDTVYMCGGSDCHADAETPEQRHLGGTLNGKEIPAETTFTTHSPSDQAWAVRTVSYGAAVFAAGNELPPTDEPVTGVIVGRPDGADAGAVYCVSGTWFASTGTVEEHVTLDSVSYLGNCGDAPPTDTLQGCIAE